VELVSREDERFVLTGDSVTETGFVAALNTALVEAGCAVSELRVERADLEATFLALTRPEPRAEEVAA
jgi:hypothetical protein